MRILHTWDYGTCECLRHNALRESRMREIRTSGSTRGRAAARKGSPLSTLLSSRNVSHFMVTTYDRRSDKARDKALRDKDSRDRASAPPAPFFSRITC